MRSLRSPHVRRKRQIRIFAKVFLTISVVLLVVAIPTIIVRLKSLQINDIQVTGTSVVSVDEVKQKVTDILSSNYFFLIPKTSVLFYPKHLIEEDVLHAFPRVETISVTSRFPHTLLIAIEERKTLALWCASTAMTDCYVLDAQGLLFDKAPAFTDNVYMIFRGDIKDQPIGKNFLSPEIFHEVNIFIEKLKSIKLVPVSTQYSRDGEFEIGLKGGGSILFSIHDDQDKSISNLSAILSDPKLSVFDGTTLSVQSIDLRYGNKVILKRK